MIEPVSPEALRAEPDTALVPAPSVSGFTHLHAGHCESGVTTAMFREGGLQLTEPLVFGVGSGLFFAHFSFVRVMGHPLTTFRSFPGAIFKAACKRLGVSARRETFRDPARGMARLDAVLAEGRRVGLQVNIYWLPYIPKAMRVHFNGHNLIVLEKRGDTYIVSDPVMECLFECPADALRRARFSGGNPLLPKGLMYWPTAVPTDVALGSAVQAGLGEVCHRMLHIPGVLPWMGVQGVGHLGRQIPTWPDRLGEGRAREWLAGVVRMQEEIGTGGAGFRFLFAAFLEQAGARLGWSALGALAPEATAVGDLWRGFALEASRVARRRSALSFADIGAMLGPIEVAERALYERLDAVRRAPQITG
jgi:hypothetical protein